jgi:hypothetical protein
MEGTDRPFLYRFLPPEVRSFFLERGWEDLELLRERYGLAPQAVEVLDTLQQEILFGYEPIDKLENLIRTRLKYDDVLTRRVAMDMVELRFLPLDAYLNAAPYRLYAAMGGNTTVLRIASVPHGGITASMVRRTQEVFLENLWEENVRRRKEEDGVASTSTPEEEGVSERNEEPVIGEPDGQDEGEASVAIVQEEEKEEEKDQVYDQAHESESESERQDDDAALHTLQEHAMALPAVQGPMDVRVVEEGAELPKAAPALAALLERDVADADPLAALKSGKTVGVAEHPGVRVVREACGVEALPPEQEKRFRVLLGSRLSGVRTQEALLAALTKPAAQGGMGFESAVAMRIGSLVATELLERHQASTQKAAQEKQAFVAARQAKWQTTPPPSPAAVEAPAPAAPQVKAPEHAPAPRAVVAKVPMVDISVPTTRKLAGPVEEFGAMTLANFRRMPGGTAGAIASLQGQIAHMNQTDPALGLSAMAAWSKSPLVVEYRRVLSRALQLGVPLERLLRDAADNPQGFTVAEVQALRVFHASMRAKAA